MKAGLTTRGSSWNGSDPGYGAGSIILDGLFGMFYMANRVKIREIG